MPESEPRRISRRELLLAGGGATGAILLGGAAYDGLIRSPTQPPRQLDPAKRGAPQVARSFRSRPDLRPPGLRVAGNSDDAGYLLFGPSAVDGSQSGPLIVDRSGEPVWFHPLPPPLWATNVAVGEYEGEPVLTWWEGRLVFPDGYGRGEGVIVDDSYRELGRVRAANGLQMDLHEFHLTPEGTALFTCYPRTARADLTKVGGPRDGVVLESVIQEVDVRTGQLLLEWRSLDHIPVWESYVSAWQPYDYLHANSIDIAPDGNLLVSARHAWTVYKLERSTGEVMWRLGGKRSDFPLKSAAQFAWQHDARYVDESTITLFDNGASEQIKIEPQSRAIVLNIDSSRRRAGLRSAFHHVKPLSAVAMGNVQVLPSGEVLVGWGSEPYISGLASNGTLLRQGAMAAGQQSYRVVQFPWRGEPRDRPAIAAASDPTTATKTLYVSWNGATEVTHWRPYAGPASDRLAPRARVRHTGFETAIGLAPEDRFAAVWACDAAGRKIAVTDTIKL